MSYMHIPIEQWHLITEWSDLNNYPGIGSGRIYSTVEMPFGVRYFVDLSGDLWQVRPTSEGGWAKVPMQGYTLAFRECNDKKYYYVISLDPNQN